MNRRATAVIVFGVFSLVLALTKDEVAAQAITVTPADPRISVGQTQQFAATGISAATAVEAGSFLLACSLKTPGCGAGAERLRPARRRDP